MPTWIVAVFILLLVVSVVAMIASRRGNGFRGPGTAAAGFVQGTLTVTGLGRENEPDKNGQRYCTLSGTIIGPQIGPTEVYGTQVLGPGAVAPSIGTDLPVVYRPGKVDSTWRLGALQD
ncbi:hypothetical protein [Gordonia neofelifaecis]|uniref:Uncharacterized protein n=1 Tax=Gordonia neofelifaecis NRRL B-59395 TaxID=644548 RepID=F1YJ64_9ACTN|nr:hypothetical protein [Gordonia neofelifaecis]EGD55279.1 hypothetical protein SCNU_10414 [Gordonia neofelifaecis NRRL B-59395]